jgi:hypothetical protein
VLFGNGQGSTSTRPGLPVRLQVLQRGLVIGVGQGDPGQRLVR